MRFYFENLTRPKRVAKHLHVLFPFQKLSATQEWTAELYGYTSWHELATVTESRHHPLSLFDEDIPKAEQDKRRIHQDEMIEEVLSLSFIDSILINLRLTSVKPARIPAKAPGVPTGRGRFYTILRHEILNEGNRATNISGSDYFSCPIIPESFGTEKSVINKLATAMKRNAYYPSFATDCKALLNSPFSGEVGWYYSGNDDELDEPDVNLSLKQMCKERVFIFDSDETPVGFVVYEVTATAYRNDDEYSSMDVNIIEAWAQKGDDEAWDEVLNVCRSAFEIPFNYILLACSNPASAPPLKLGLSFSTESEFLFGAYRKFNPFAEDGFLEMLATTTYELNEFEENPFRIYYDL